MTRADPLPEPLHHKPLLSELLDTVGLGVEWHRGRGDALFTRGADGEEVEVLDLLGGYGANLFGHDHPVLREALIAAISAGRPVNAQASRREPARRLARRISDLVARHTGRPSYVLFCSSGAEAVEAALKHACLEAEQRRAGALAELELRLAALVGRAEPPTVPPDAPEILRAARSPGALCEALLGVARAALDEPPTVLAVEGAFHGKSAGALAVTHDRKYREPFALAGLRTVFIPRGEVAAVGEAARGATRHWWTLAEDGSRLEHRGWCAVVAAVAEPVQGEGGIHPLSPELLGALRAAAEEGGFPLIVDEIQCGLGRTGTLLACEQSGVRADYHLLGKALGGGLCKLACVAIDQARYVPSFDLAHTSTFADDDLSSLVGLAALDLIEADDGALVRRCAERGAELLGALQALQARFPTAIRAVRGVGLMAGLELSVDQDSRLLGVLRDQRLLGYVVCGYLLRRHRIRVAPTLSAHQTLRIEPSAYVSSSAIARLSDGLADVCALLASGHAAGLLEPLTRAEPGFEPLSQGPRPSAGPPQPRLVRAIAPCPRVAFLVHFSEPADLLRLDPALAGFSSAQCEALLARAERLLAPFEIDRFPVVSSEGTAVEVVLIGVPFTTASALHTLRRGSAWSADLVCAGVDLARELGCGLVGLGGHTSIVTRAARDARRAGVGVTSGNSLTVATAWDAVKLTCRAAGIELDGATVGIVGAAGNIGGGIAELAACSSARVLLVGHPRHARFMEDVRARAQRASRREGAVRVALGLDALRACEVVVSASNSPSTLVEPEHLGEATRVVCDVAVPRDVSPDVAARPGVMLLHGGVVRLPDGNAVSDLCLANERDVFACFAETVLLGLSGVARDFSVGPIELGKVLAIAGLARTHGFETVPNVVAAGPSNSTRSLHLRPATAVAGS